MLDTLSIPAAPRLAATLRARIDRIDRIAPLDDTAAFRFTLLMTLLLVLLYSPSQSYVKAPASVLALAALFHPPLARDSRLWLLFTGLLATACYHTWYTVDNHKVLLVYWCATLFLAFEARDPQGALASAARRLIGLVFALATAAKLWAPDFLTGDFFTYTLLSDDRFTRVTPLLGLDAASARANEVALDALRAMDSSLGEVVLAVPPQLASLALAMTAWTILIEGAVALAFLWPLDRGPSRLRDPLLLAFVASTYLLAPVTGFGWVLLAMGMAQSSPSRPRLRMAYLAAFLLLQAYHFPWTSLTPGL